MNKPITKEKKARTRLNPEDRRKEILHAAMKVFIEKGYKNCSVADLVFASGLSAGGFYHYYKDKSEILYDLMKEGNKQRFDLMLTYMKKHPEVSGLELMAELTLDKLLDKNDLKKIYVIFLQELKTDKRLRDLYRKMISESKKDFAAFCKEHNLQVLSHLDGDIFIALINCIYLGIELLDLRALFVREREHIKKALLKFMGELEDKHNE
ncbi:TetR/AcrR family transcriptional regulator [Treponema phagedenis]|uniref:Transcriptional regulator, TetR family n=1 Tax=Treponema phagedenis TaxID=162 RepID=A0A0B7GYZ5_TREPH|nr:TetR/AcrR family transcriptional regulator [Treponema phagedenis]QEJ93854.1 TetR/AcrR family transcriptional regulator [Treponema phagedenis]QEK07293.1 TetR/AcrR family transcriptional regulator [Treponema phagedenis]QSH94792.1 TetR/AcrR family transcriptional regulator [Treponema phagedenis]QSI00349.1 TetR/AcrR family transcriptional regulator [Treponema phagedenis]CEM61886.1 Transcriptional regulator, TetR family [Treponema phagedenis]